MICFSDVCSHSPHTYTDQHHASCKLSTLQRQLLICCSSPLNTVQSDRFAVSIESNNATQWRSQGAREGGGGERGKYIMIKHFVLDICQTTKVDHLRCTSGVPSGKCCRFLPRPLAQGFFQEVSQINFLFA